MRHSSILIRGYGTGIFTLSETIVEEIKGIEANDINWICKHVKKYAWLVNVLNYMLHYVTLLGNLIVS